MIYDMITIKIYRPFIGKKGLEGILPCYVDILDFDRKTILWYNKTPSCSVPCPKAVVMKVYVKYHKNFVTAIQHYKNVIDNKSLGSFD